MRRIFTEKLLHRLILILIVIQPIIDLDYLAYGFLDSYGLPRPATIIRFLIIPAFTIWSFCLHDKQKKRTFVFALFYGIAFLAYFYLHCRQAEALYPRLDLTENFRFSTWQELTYVLTLALPYAAVYFIYHEHFDRKELRSMVLFLSGIISIPIVIGDLYVFADSTYYGKTVGNVFSWFSGIYSWYHPRTLASKFFFNEGNTIGILLFMILPLECERTEEDSASDCDPEPCNADAGDPGRNLWRGDDAAIVPGLLLSGRENSEKENVRETGSAFFACDCRGFRSIAELDSGGSEPAGRCEE